MTDNAPAAPRKKVRIQHLAKAYEEGRPLTMLTAYDALTAAIFDRAGLDMLLVGDSLGNVVLGHSGTLPVTMDDMVAHTAAVARGAHAAFIVADLPFGSYEASPQQAFESAARLMKAGANAVKLEGGEIRAETVHLLTQSGIPVCGHLGYTPQSENTIGGPRVRGRGDQHDQMIADAKALQDAGAFAVVLEMVPSDLANQVTAELHIPTIGIGAGPGTSGQVLVWADMAGMTEWTPSFVRRFGEIGAALEAAAGDYVAAVTDRSFPSQGHYHES